MVKDSTFGSDPDRLQRLLSVGIETETPPESRGAVDPLDILLEKPGAKIGRYELLEVLGEGGMGIVYLAQQCAPVRRQVALKVVKPGMDSRRVIARFEAEQQALALMDHAHVARVYDGGLTASGRPYFVMEYVDGVPITRYCDERRLPIEQRLHLFLRVCEAVQHAHQKGIIHRDLKPSNVMVVVQDKKATPKVIDFGVARALSRSLTEQTLATEQGQLIGTPEYMSPEQANVGNQDIDMRSDVYSLGVILYRLLTRQLPFESQLFRAGGIDQIRKVLTEHTPKAPSARLKAMGKVELIQVASNYHTDSRTLPHRLAGDLDWITLKALEKDRVRRYATVDAFALDISKHLRHEPIAAAPPDLAYITKKFIQRHRSAVLSTLVLTVLASVIASSIVMYVKAKRARRYAQSLQHNQLLADAQTLLTNKQYEPVRSQLAPLLDSEHVGRRARLLHAQATVEIDGPNAAVAELQDLLGQSDQIAGRAHFLLAKIFYENEGAPANVDDDRHAPWAHHQQQAENLVPGIARYYFLRKQTALQTQDKLELLRRSIQQNADQILGEPVYLGPAINSPEVDMTPSISADGLTLYFTSNRPGCHGDGDWDIWMATRPSTSADWPAAVNVGLPVSTAAMEWFPGISSDGRELYFCRGSWGQGNLYVATRQSPEEPWQAAIKLCDAINGVADDYAPSISCDGLSLYFVSERPGGPGDIDMWVAKRPTLDGEWGCPDPLPPPINSPGKEGHKCLSADGLIMFFQRFQGGNANKSLYVTTRDTKADPWSEPIDLGPVPLPGSSIPAIYSLSSDGSELYFCDHPWFESQPHGQGKADLWYFPIVSSVLQTAHK